MAWMKTPTDCSIEPFHILCHQETGLQCPNETFKSFIERGMNKKRVAALFTLSLSKNASRGYMPMESFASSIMSHIRCAHEPLKILFTFEKFLNFGTSFRSKLFIFSKNLRSIIFFCLFPRIRDRRLPRDHEVVYFLPFISCCRAFLVSLPFGKILFCFCCFGDCEGV